MSLLLALLYVAPPEPPAPTARGSNGAQRKPKRGRFEVDRFSDFSPQPIAIRKSDDDELMLIYMMI